VLCCALTAFVSSINTLSALLSISACCSWYWEWNDCKHQRSVERSLGWPPHSWSNVTFRGCRWRYVANWSGRRVLWVDSAKSGHLQIDWWKPISFDTRKVPRAVTLICFLHTMYLSISVILVIINNYFRAELWFFFVIRDAESVLWGRNWKCVLVLRFSRLMLFHW